MVIDQQHRGVESWTERDKRICESKYAYPVDYQYAEEHGVHVLDGVIYRVASGIAEHATDEHLHVAGVKTQDELRDKLIHIMAGQYAMFNSPVLFNVGIQEKPQCWACLILDVGDDMTSIKKWWMDETDCFLGGSGAGLNVSNIRADGEPLSGGRGTGSGPLSFMRAADSIAGSIKSGGRTRRAAKMVILDVDHPDIEEFIESKARVERMKNVLQQAGFDFGLNGRDHDLIQYQNANISVRVTDEFMDALSISNADWRLKSRVTGETTATVTPNVLWRKIATAAWECADPGVQFHDTINNWHTTPSRGPIVASNPCSEYMHICNSVCNLASLNLMRFWYLEEGEGQTFDQGLFDDVVRTMIVSMDIIVDMSSYPNEEVEKNSRELRNLGLGYTNLGALLMALGIGYDTVEGRSVAAALTSHMMMRAVRTSAELAGQLEPHAAWESDRLAHMNVLHEHSLRPKKWRALNERTDFLWKGLSEEWQTALDLAEANGQRNAQLTVIAPTGTISFALGAETTGIEPVMAVAAQKELVGGGSIDVGVQRCVELGVQTYVNNLRNETFDPENGVAELLRTNEVFATAIGDNMLRPEAHVYMMAAVQPSIMTSASTAPWSARRSRC